MRESERLADQLRRAVEGEAWHGPSVIEILEGVGAKAAVARPLKDAHSIWEILLHVTAWTDAVRGRLNGKALQLPPEEDWPVIEDKSEAAWKRSQQEFRAAQDRLLQKIEALSEAELAATTPGKPYNNAFMLDGIVQHHLYHAGQMAVLKKATANS